LHTAGDDSNLKNRWEEFCWHYYGESVMMQLWDDYMKGEIASTLDKLKEINRFEIWLATQKGQEAVSEFLMDKFESDIPIEYLNVDKLCQEMYCCVEDIHSEVYNLMCGLAWDYAIDKNWD
jgi:hypothetical protein